MHLVHPEPPTFCGFQASGSPKETPRPPYQWSAGGAGGQHSRRTVGANSRWLHHTAVRYVRKAQRGAYTWWKGLNSIKTGSKWAKTTCLTIPNGPESLLEKCVFDPFLTHFWSQNDPFSRHFGIFRGPKRATTGSKRPKNTFLSIPSGLRKTLEKIIFFAPGTLVYPPLAPTVRGLCCSPAAPSDHWYGGLGVS